MPNYDNCINMLYTYKKPDSEKLTKDMLWFFCKNCFELHGRIHLQ